jgi:protein-disulfide isomerase
VYNAAVWLREVESGIGEPLRVTWRSFPLEQVNSEDEGYTFWELAPEDAGSLRAFLAAEAARKQGEDIFRGFVDALLKAVHQDKKRVQEPDTIEAAAQDVPGLDREQLQRDMDDPASRQKIAQDYRQGADEYGVFGTPTFLFAGGDPVFLKMSPPARGGEAVSLFETVRAMSLERPYVQELKKPRKPEKKG